MARCQGDSFKTWTNHSLNRYKRRLMDKKLKLIDYKEKWYRAGHGWILAAEYNRLVNPNGYLKWDGWEIEAHVYDIRVFPEECVEIKDGKPHVIGWSQVVKTIDDDKAYANEYFNKVAVKLARNLKTWMPPEVDNAPAFDYEGRKPEAAITMSWDGDTYFYTLVVDGKKVLNAYRREECVREAERLGAELRETHTL